MSTRKRPAHATSKGLGDEDARRLITFMPDIAHTLLPSGTPVYVGNGKTRFGRKGSLKLDASGRWYDHEAGTGDHGGISLIAHLLPPGSPLDAKAWAQQWLSAHQGIGSLTIESTAETEAREKRLAEYAQRALNEMVDIEGTPGEDYLVRERGLAAPWPSGLGYWPTARSSQGEGALVASLTDQAGKVVAVHLVFLDPRGRKSTVPPMKQIFRLTSREAAVGAFYRINGEAPDPLSDPPADPTDPEHLHHTVLVAEGIEDALAVHIASPYSTVLGMPGVGRLKFLTEQLTGLTIVVRDGDQPNSKADKALADGLDDMLLAGAQSIRVAATPLDKDANDILRELGPDALRRLIIEAKPAQLSREGDIKRLARMSSLDVTKAERKAVAQRWDTTVPELNKAITAERNRAATENAPADDQGEDQNHWEETAWADPVSDIGAVLDEALAEIRRYVVTEEYNLATMCVWPLFTHIVHRDDLLVPISPRLAIQAEEKNCGKTTALNSVACMVLRPKPVLSTTAAAFFRIISKYRPTVLLDEADKAFRRGYGVDLLQLINGGHSRGFTGVDRVEEIDGTREVVTYDAWGAVALAGIGRLHEATTQSRCIVIQMHRAKSNEQPEHMKHGRSAVLEQVRQKFARWCSDLKLLADIKLPPGLINRTGDNWEPMLQLAHLAGPRWWDLILKAARADVASETSADGTATPLLYDIREVLGGKARLRSEGLCSGLLVLADPSGDWRRCNRGGEINPYYLRTKLRNLLKPPGAQQWKEGRSNVRGYLAEQFKDAFERYLDQPQQSGGASAGSSAPDDAAQPSREHGNGAATDANITSSGENGAESPARTEEIRNPSGTSGTSATKTNITNNDTEIDPQTAVPDGDNLSGTASGTMGPDGGAATNTGLVPDTVPDELPPSGTRKAQARTASPSLVPDVPDVPDQFRGERSLKTRPAALDSTPGSNPELQKRNKVQGPKEELW
jgi:putative DNA primase/helicase